MKILPAVVFQQLTKRWARLERSTCIDSGFVVILQARDVLCIELADLDTVEKLSVFVEFWESLV